MPAAIETNIETNGERNIANIINMANTHNI